MRSNLALLLVVAVGSVAVAACGSVAAQNDAGAGNGGAGSGRRRRRGGSAGADGGIDAGPPTVEEACGQFASTLCSRLGGCAPYALQLFYGDNDTCVSRVKLGCMRDLEVPDSNQTTDRHGRLRARRKQLQLRRPAGERVPGFLSDQARQQVERRAVRIQLAVHEHALREVDRRLRRVRAARGRRRRVHRRRGLHRRAWCAPRRSASRRRRWARRAARWLPAARTFIAARSATPARRRWRWARRAGAIPAGATSGRVCRATPSLRWRIRSARPSPPRKAARRAASSTAR